MKRCGIASVVVAGILLVGGGAGCSDFVSFWGGRRLSQDVASMEDPIFADERRIGIAGLQQREEGSEAVYEERFRQIALVDSSPQVRAQAVRALNQARDPYAQPVYLAAAREPAPAVQLEAVKALRHAPDERAIPRLTELASNDRNNRDVRVWAARALGSYPRLEVARTLVALLDARDFGVAYEARQSLKFMTGKDFHFDGSLWLGWLTRPEGGTFKHSGPTTRKW